jgi:dephospho-CoA kinase
MFVWLAGGTGSGKCMLATALAQRFGADIYDGDLGERSYLAATPPSISHGYSPSPP